MSSCLQRGRVEQHVQPLGILWLIYMAYRILTWLVAIPFLSGVFGGMRWMRPGFPFQHTGFPFPA